MCEIVSYIIFVMYSLYVISLVNVILCGYVFGSV